MRIAAMTVAKPIMIRKGIAAMATLSTRAVGFPTRLPLSHRPRLLNPPYARSSSSEQCRTLQSCHDHCQWAKENRDIARTSNASRALVQHAARRSPIRPRPLAGPRPPRPQPLQLLRTSSVPTSGRAHRHPSAPVPATSSAPTTTATPPVAVTNAATNAATNVATNVV